MQLKHFRRVLQLCLIASTLEATVTNVTDAAGLITALAACATGDQINIKSGAPYVLTAPLVIPAGCTRLTLSGYQTSPGDEGAKPLLTTATNSTILLTNGAPSAVFFFDNLSMSNTAAVRANGFAQITTNNTQGSWLITNSVLDGFAVAIATDNAGSDFWVQEVNVLNTEVKNSTSSGFAGWTGVHSFVGSWFHNNLTNIKSVAGGTILIARSVVSDAGITGATTAGILMSAAGALTIIESAVANNASDGVYSVGATLNIIDSVFWGNTRYGIEADGTGLGQIMDYNAFGGNGIGPRHLVAAGTHDVTLSASPFLSGTDFGLNAAAGGGALLRGAGFPGLLPGGLSTAGHLDTGALQSPSAGAFAFAAP